MRSTGLQLPLEVGQHIRYVRHQRGEEVVVQDLRIKVGQRVHADDHAMAV